jgi:CRP-like cAMP-binding protein
MIEKFISSFNLFPDSEIERFTQMFVTRTIKKAEYFVREGGKCKEIAFVQNGIFRSFYTLENGTEHTFCFRFPNQLLAPYSAFISGEASRETMQAITDATVLVLKKSALEAHLRSNPEWTSFLKTIAEQEYIELEKRYFQLQRDDAATRYKDLLCNQPEYIQSIPLQYLASYLGISPRHLSRIRKEITF